jgi:hypothetical protein
MALTKLTTNLISGDIVTSVNGSSGAVTLETGTDWQTAIQTSNFTAVASKGYFVNTTSAEITVTLPVGVVGTEIVIQDYAGTFATNKVILAANGSEKIQGVTIGGQITTNNATTTLIYQDSTKGWNAQDVSLIPQDFSGLSYLVVAGGGGGGGGTGSTGGGGGGAGGFRTNYLGTTLTLNRGVNYTVTVGAGGAGGPGSYPTGYGANGTDSIFYNITSTKGGGGSAYSSGTAGAGGSGGGGAYNSSGSPVSAKGAGNTPSTTPSQGNDGGIGQNNPNYGGGGGGGASAAGANAPTSQGGDGGAGTNNSITGTALAYAGGGGGGTGNYSGNQSSGGNGGGGNGGHNGSPTGGNASPANRGSGGGGGGEAGAGSGGNGSSGVVIVRYPNSLTLSYLNSLSGTTTTVGTDKVTTFTTGTGTIQFN